MEDEKIVQLYWERDEQAIVATSQKYGAYCKSIALNILRSEEDAQECVSDTYLKAWNAMPPHRPKVLSAFLGKITRNLSLNRWKSISAEKRGGGQINAVLDELEEFLTNGQDGIGHQGKRVAVQLESSMEGRPEEQLQRKQEREELLKAFNDFLEGLPAEKRKIFVCRYWYFDSISDIAKRFHLTENNVSVTLNRLRLKLHNYLLERGFEL